MWQRRYGAQSAAPVAPVEALFEALLGLPSREVSFDNVEEELAGVVGFEPTVHATKKRCLTAWLHPISEALNTMKAAMVQAPKWQKRQMI